ncbi:rubrerythrin family protein [bacterium]|nr:rubrerythrin family protein [bacterium]
MNFKGSNTEQNLLEAFIGESKARNKYTFYASRARKDGYETIARVFEETANNEKEHAKIWFKYLIGGDIPDTLTNLKDASEGERYEWTTMYKNFAQTAKNEGFDEIAHLFDTITTVEKFHNQRYDRLIEDLEKNKLFKAQKPVIWECANCGFHILSVAAPEKCPLCAHPKAFFFNKEDVL